MDDSIAYYTAKLKKIPLLSISVLFPKVPFSTQATSSFLPPKYSQTPLGSYSCYQNTSSLGSLSLEGRETRGQIIFSLLTFRMLMNRKCYLLLMSKNKCKCYIPMVSGGPQPTCRGCIQVTCCGQGCAGADPHQLTSATSLSSSTFRDVRLVTQNWLWWECLHYGNGQVQQTRAFP